MRRRGFWRCRVHSHFVDDTGEIVGEGANSTSFSAMSLDSGTERLRSIAVSVAAEAVVRNDGLMENLPTTAGVNLTGDVAR